MESKRQLAAIMFTDIVGYTALMGSDEQRAMDLLRANRKLHKHLIQQHNGKWLKEMGDGVLASFPTISNAVYCAGAIQMEASQIDGLELRVGIHQGEVIVEGEDIYGDGVNIASRIEGLADSGQILVSETIYKNIRNKQGIETIFLGEKELKNVPERVKIYDAKVESGEAALLSTKLPSSAQTNQRKVLLAAAGVLVILVLGYIGNNFLRSTSQLSQQINEKSIAVLPFRNESSNQENQYFCNGIMEGILDHLAKIPDLTVISRTSVEQYRDSPPSMKVIAEELGVHYLVEGSVQRIGDRAFIFAQLIHANSDNHLWSKRYDRNLKDIFFIQTEITHSIAGELKVAITPDVGERIENTPTSNSIAYDLYLQGKEYYNQYLVSNQIQALNNAERLFLAALNQDSTFALSYAGLASVYYQRNAIRDIYKDIYLDTVRILCQKAIDIDEFAADAYFMRGVYHLSKRQRKQAENDWQKAIELAPNHTEALRRLSGLRTRVQKYVLLKKLERLDRSPEQLALTYLTIGALFRGIGDWEKAIHYFHEAKRIHPLLDIGHQIMWLNVLRGNFQEAIESLVQDSSEHLSAMGDLYWYLGENEKAIEFYERWSKNVNIDKPRTGQEISDWRKYGSALLRMGRTREATEMLEGHLQRTEGNWFDAAAIHAVLGDKEKSIDYLIRYDEFQPWHGWGGIYYLQVEPSFDEVRNDVRYQEIVNRVLQESSEYRKEIDRLETSGESLP